MKKLAQFSVDYPVTVAMIILGIILLGIISLSRLGTDLFPDLNNPKIVVDVEVGESPPEEIEKQYIEKMEATIVRQDGVTNVSSVCQVGEARITVEYDWDQDMDEAYLDIQKALSSYTQGDDSDIDELDIYRNDPNASPIMLVALSNNDISDMNELRKIAENYVKNELIRVDGIADVKLSGDEEREIVVETDRYKLKAFGLTASDIVNKIDEFNQNVSGGTIEEMGENYVVKGSSLFSSPEDLGELIVGTSNDTISTPILLKDIATVKYQNQDPDNIVKLNGKRCIGLSIYKETQFNTVAAIEAINKEFDVIKKALPGYTFTVIKNQGKFISDSINEVKSSALFGILLAVIILYVFLKRIGVTFIISAAIPISIIATFNLMYFNGLTLNIMTLGGLALGAGMLVDNAIVVVENIFSMLEKGVPLREAAVKGTANVSGALTASTLTTIVVFLPIVYLHGASGELFKDTAWTVAFSLLSSLFVAILIIPILTVLLFGRSKSKKQQPKAKDNIRYMNFLSKVIQKRYLVILMAVVLVVLSYVALHFVGSEFMPKAQSNEFTLNVNLPAGTSLKRTASTINSIHDKVVSLIGDQVENIYEHAGPENSDDDSDDSSSGGNSEFEGDNTGYLKVILKEEALSNSDNIIAKLNEVFDGVKGMDITIEKEQTALTQLLGSNSSPFVVEISGEDLTVLDTLSNRVYQELSKTKGLLNLTNSFEDGTPEVNVVIDKYRAGLYGLSASTIVSSLEDFLMGTDAGQIETDGELTDITIKMPDYPLKDIDEFVITSGDEEYRLSDVAKINIGTSARQVIRDNQNRVGLISADVSNDISIDKLAAKVKAQLDKMSFPSGYRYKIKGEEVLREESFGNLLFALILSIILVYMVMASQFESLIHPFTILLTIPLAGVGAIGAFFILGISMNIMAYIGMVMLAGIAVNDSIILVDAINQNKQAGEDLINAILKAANSRLRPIIMTSLTTILGLLPMTLGIGESSSIRSSMAIAVIGGLITSTILTLIVIPCVYYIFDQAMVKVKRMFS